MGGNEYFMQVSVCLKYWLALLIFGVSCWMTWREAYGSWNALTLAKGISPTAKQLPVLDVDMHLVKCDEMECHTM
jgi:hypothetical protein